MMDQIIIRDLLTRGSIGITEEERKRPQDILVNLVLFTDTTKPAETDSLDDCINYSLLSKQIFALVEHNKRKTVEALTNDIAAKCLEHELVRKVRVRAEKTSAVRFTMGVGVEIEREK